MIGGIVGVALILATILISQGLYIKAKAMLAQVLLNQAWAETMETNEPTRPWPWMDTWPIARIEVPRLEQSAIALAGASGQALAFAPVHLRQSAMPGARGTSVFAAHRDTHFTFMAQLKEGDRINMTNSSGEIFEYEIQSFRIVPWNNSGIDPDSLERKLALVTCWPLDGTFAGPMRFIAEANLVSSAPVLTQ
ncbi:MAG: class GN sortase [Rhizobiales bacterium]|nr:class GN sortase [Hyphomicrobiales bacterium]